MSLQGINFETDTWSVSRLGDLIENLAKKSKLCSPGANLPAASENLLELDQSAISRWIEVAAGYLGLETEMLDASYLEMENLLRSGGPLILQLPRTNPDSGGRLVALVGASHNRVLILCTDLRVRRRKLEALRAILCAPFEIPYIESIEELIADAQVPPEKQLRARQAILDEQLGSIRIQVGWLLRLSPGSKLSSQLGHGGVLSPIFILIGMYVLQQFLTILSWFVIGQGIFQGNFDMGWLIAWVILLLATIPLQLIVSDREAELSLAAGALFKQRLLYGILKLEPEEIRHQGMGQFLGRVMESEAVEMLVLSGGFTAFLSIIELFLAGIILAKGAGGSLQAVELGVWMLITTAFLWRYYAGSREWSKSYRDMTNDLVESLVGHRTRLAQEDHEQWHVREDQSLDQYLTLSERMDDTGIHLNSTVRRGWILIGLAGIAYPFITNSASIQSLAIALGGILYAAQALNKLVGGSQSLIGLLIAWQQVSPLFNAATRQEEQASLDLISFQPDQNQEIQVQVPAPPRESDRQPLLTARNLYFRYRPQGRYIIQDISLDIFPGEKLLLEGPSGGGKSTLATLLTGLRNSESGSLLLWGYDRQMIGSHEWRRRVAMAPQFQENYIFSETFGFNLLMGRRWPPTPDDLREAEDICRELGLDSVLDRMPSGYQQMLGESGWQLSHGERSRLYIARSLLQNADLIILDESFAALDPENLQRAMQCVLQRAQTLLVIAHP
jgi:ATP-binding cassette subfamily B protein